MGYVNLFYLTPESRGQGLGEQLEAHARDYWAARGCQTLRLSVHPDNTAAWRYYRRGGWRDLGRREGESGVHVLEKDFQCSL